MRTSLYSGLAILLSLVGPAHASPSSAKWPQCKGQIAYLYLDRIKKGGSLKGLADAQTAHRAWYRANGITDNKIVLAPIVATDEKTGAYKPSATEILVLHINPPLPKETPNAGDASWKTYVAEYNANSQILRQWEVCLPDLGQ